ncbi:hypothetical protein KSF78_0008479 [Schistosoma japonicum]|nr:hypothetical protein KSF78_0008479 [Schistosoma japonicum]
MLKIPNNLSKLQFAQIIYISTLNDKNSSFLGSILYMRAYQFTGMIKMI